MIKVQLIRNDEDCIVGEVKEFTITTAPEPENDNEYALFGMSFKDEIEEVFWEIIKDHNINFEKLGY